MKKQFIVTKEEMETIKRAVSEVLDLWNYEFISASNESGSNHSMNKETFFQNLENEFIVKE